MKAFKRFFTAKSFQCKSGNTFLLLHLVICFFICCTRFIYFAMLYQKNIRHTAYAEFLFAVLFFVWVFFPFQKKVHAVWKLSCAKCALCKLVIKFWFQHVLTHSLRYYREGRKSNFQLLYCVNEEKKSNLKFNLPDCFNHH